MTANGPILIGIGANLSSARFGAPLNACTAALEALDALDGVRVAARSRWFESEPVPKSDQPWFVNGVARVETALAPLDLLARLHDIEADFGRVRTVPNAPRVLDLDLLAYGDEVLDAPHAHIPHARLEGRAFVVLPLGDVAPDWVHPKSGRALSDLRADLPADQVCRPIDDGQPAQP